MSRSALLYADYQARSALESNEMRDDRVISHNCEAGAAGETFPRVSRAAELPELVVLAEV